MSYLKVNPNISYLRVFGCKWFILNNGKGELGKINSKVDARFFLRYSSSSKDYRVFKNITFIVEESVHMDFDETKLQETRKGSSPGFGVSRIIIEYLVNDNTSLINPPKMRILKLMKMKVNNRMTNTIPRESFLKIGLL